MPLLTATDFVDMANEKPRELIIEAGRAEQQYWRDLWHFRELFYILAWRDILVRYKQTVIGIGWAVIRPFVTVVVFNRIAKLEAPAGLPYALFVAAAITAEGCTVEHAPPRPSLKAKSSAGSKAAWNGVRAPSATARSSATHVAPT